MDAPFNNRATSGRHIKVCAKCLMPNSRPRIQFDEQGVCNACRHGESKPVVDWEARRAEFLELLDLHRSKDGSWDCVVPWSGGKDSSYVAHRLKYEFGMTPLLVTFSPMMPTEIGNANREALLNQGFDSLFFRPDQKIMRHMARRFFVERGNPKICWDAGVNALPVRVAAEKNISLVFYAEHGESEYGGKVLSEEHQKKRDFTEVIEHQIGDDPNNWIDGTVSRADLNPYLYPPLDMVKKRGVTAYYFGYFFRWSMLENYEYIRDKYTFQTAPGGRTEGTFTNFDSVDDKIDGLYYYMQFVKFGFGRAVRDACRMIQNNQMTREEAIANALPFDGEFPARYHADVLEYLMMDEEEFRSVVDRHRNPEIWKNENGSWALTFDPAGPDKNYAEKTHE
ncbi:hypothetical protein BerOc1_01980 [Pseudodesulfovibrio hydrargyri]|uniref:N-acetyl sugar amidotransferase n=1 Tax=Pseudodesulfovibrio hydrargyri TaxID=2125990 RepID=A0A1J5MVP7_9BACT|nr:N-acetyl sugar amidotransferase [Pseudodesulfovibrio hydrargyri]OIQ50050.1 hypothetical protein BerOc1_01980 [Pseudodesulfovibrio hydrargyri]